MAVYHTPLLAERTYHLFNRAVGSEKVFREADNHRYFLSKLHHYITPIADVLCYSLLPNHFHLLIRIKSEKELYEHFELKKGNHFDIQQHSLPDFIMEQFSNWLNGYVKAFNKKYNRKGSLFMDYLKRSEASNDYDITAFIFYIHKNAVHHGLTKQIGDWPHDSYQTFLSEKPTTLKRDEVIQWFGGKTAFKEFHSQPVQLKEIHLEEGL